jgi:hypothetical protein
MRYRLYLFLVTAFFITMNVLLWRSEFVERGHLGAPVPTELVWEKVLTSPDPSYLEIRHHGVKIGRAQWTTSIGEQVSTNQVVTDELPPEGMVKTLAGYSLSFDGAVSLDDLSRLRFDFNVKLDTNQNWRTLNVKFTIKPFSWEIQSSAEEQTLRFLAEGDERINRTFTFGDLRNPEKIVRELGGPAPPGALAALGLPLPQANPSSATLALKWEAHNDRIEIRDNLIRVYRLEARLFERLKATLFVSPVGEILRLELPDEIVMVNEALINL